MKNNNVKIMIMDGNNIKKAQEGRNVNMEYKGVFAYSLVLNKLRELGLNEKLGKTRDIIGLEFVHRYISNEADKKISDYTFEKIESNKLNKEIKEMKNRKKILLDGKKMSECSEDIKNEIRNINSLMKEKKELRKEKIDSYKNKREDIYKNHSVSKKEIRLDLYTNGFDLTFNKYNKETNKYDKEDETIHYVFWFRSPSKTRTGDAIFINEKLYNKIIKWQCMGIELEEDNEGNVKKIEMESYKSLTSSAIENTFELDPKNILVINDLKSYATYDCSLVKVDENGHTYVENCDYELSNTLFDGQALGDKSIFPRGYKEKGMIVGRHHFFKACIFNTNIKKFMMDFCDNNGYDYDEYEVEDRYGNKIKVKDVLLITTENAMKWEKFFSNKSEGYKAWCEAINNDNNIFGLVKTTHKSKYSKAGLQRMSYQMVNTLPIEKEQIEELLKPTIDYINGMKGKDSLGNFIEYLEATKDNTNENEMLLDILKINKDFSKSKFFNKRKKKQLYQLTNKKVRSGKLFTTGDNLTVVGNPYSMLLHSVGLVKHENNIVSVDYEDITLPVLDKECVSVYAKGFDDGEYLSSIRNPHNSPNNLGYNKNYKNDIIEKYFNFDNNILAVNLIRTNEQDRKNGQDQDSDFNMVTNQKVMVEASKKAQKFRTIVNCIPQKGKKYKDSLEELALIDDGLGKAKNDIGISSNMAQIAMSWYWDIQSEKLADYVSILSVIAQCAIDSSKREYDIKIANEIGRIRKEIKNIVIKEKGDKIKVKNKNGNYIYSILPKFWQYTNETILKKNEEDNKQAISELVECECPMDWIQEFIEIENDSKCNTIDDVKFINIVKGKQNKTMQKNIIKSCEKYDKENKKLHKEMKIAKTDTDKEKINKQLANLLDELIKDFSKVNLDENHKPKIEDYYTDEQIKKEIEKSNKKNEIALKTMQMLINSCFAEKGKNKKYQLLMLKMLHKTHKKSFLKCIKLKCEN